MPKRTVRPGRAAIGRGGERPPEFYRRWRQRKAWLLYPAGTGSFRVPDHIPTSPSDPDPPRYSAVDDHPLMRRLIEALAVLDAMRDNPAHPSPGIAWPVMLQEPGDYRRTKTPIASGVAIDRMDETLQRWWPHCPEEHRRLLWLRAEGRSYPSIVDRLGLDVTPRWARERARCGVLAWEAVLRRLCIPYGA